MGVLLDENTRLLIQGFGGAGQREARNCIDYGTNVVAGVTPGKGGNDLDGIPIFDTVAESVDEAGANTAMVFVSIIMLTVVGGIAYLLVILIEQRVLHYLPKRAQMGF